MKVSEFMKTWHKLREMLLKRSTFEAEEIYVEKHLIPFFESMAGEIEEIKPLHVQMYVHTKLQKGRADGAGGLSVVSVRKHLSVLRQILDDAVVYGYLQSNPAAVVKMPKEKRYAKERTVLYSANEVRKMLDALEGTQMQVIVALTVIYGLRRSEVLGLRWDAIDFWNNILRIRHTVVKNLSIQAEDRTKSECSMRSFQLLPEIREMLLRYRKSNKSGICYLFERKRGEPMRPDTLTRSFQRHICRLGFQRMTFHELRHSTATFLFDEGWNLEDVKAWLGHADIETTSNLYLHYLKERKVLLAQNLSGKFGLEQEKQPENQ